VSGTALAAGESLFPQTDTRG